MQFISSLHPISKSTAMKEEISFYIPKPCHENWDNMTPEGKGRFCASCSKQVVDFSLMSDQQVLNYFTEASGKVCGRFANDQLQRPMQPVKVPKKKSWWYAAMMPLLMVFGKQDDSKNSIVRGEVTSKDTIPPEPIMGKVNACIPTIKSDTTVTINRLVTLGMTLPMIVNDTTKEDFPPEIILAPIDTSFTLNDTRVDVGYKIGMDTIADTTNYPVATIVKGYVFDRNKQPITFATIGIKQEKLFTTTNNSGEFEVTLPESENNDFIMQVFAVGYQDKEIQVSKTGNSNENSLSAYDLDGHLIHKEIILDTVYVDEAISGEVVVVGYSACAKKVKKTDTLKTSVKKLFSIENFKLYPNPVAKGNALHIQLKTAGEYSMQLLDNNSRLIAAEEFTATTDNLTTSIDIPPSLAAGLYYVRVIDEKKKKQYTDKIIVQ